MISGKVGKRIVIFAHFAGSPRHGMVLGHWSLAKQWVALGHDVTIISASFAHTRHHQPKAHPNGGCQIIDGIRYVWLPTPAYQPASALGRVINILAYSLRAFKIAGSLAPADLVVASSHHPFAFMAAERLARRSSARIVFEVRDLWPLTLIELGRASRLNPIIVAMQWAEDRAYRRADRVVSVLPHALEYMVSRGLDPTRFVYIPNGMDPTVPIEPLPQHHVEVLDRFRASGDLVIGYAGRIGVANALHVILEALATENGRGARLVILGHGPAEAALMTAAEQMGIEDRFLILPPVDRTQVGDFLARIDLGYLGFHRSPLYRFGISPTKINDYLLAGLPILLAANAPCEVTDEAGIGWKVPPDDPMAIAQTIATVRRLDPDARKRIGQAGRTWAMETRTYSALAERFLTAAFESI